MNCAIYLLFQFTIFLSSYLNTSYKSNKIKTKSSTRVKSYFPIYLDKETGKHSTLDLRGT